MFTLAEVRSYGRMSKSRLHNERRLPFDQLPPPSLHLEFPYGYLEVIQACITRLGCHFDLNV